MSQVRVLFEEPFVYLEGVTELHPLFSGFSQMLWYARYANTSFCKRAGFIDESIHLQEEIAG